MCRPTAQSNDIRPSTWFEESGDAGLGTTVLQAPSPARLREWDDLVRSVPGSDVAQLSGWARLRGHVGYQPEYVFAHEDGQLSGGAQILFRRAVGLGAFGYLSNGPLVSPTAENPGAVHGAVVDAVIRLARRNFRMFFVQPPEGAQQTSDALLKRDFRHSDADIAPAATLRVALDVDEVQLRRNLSKRLRTWTNQWDHRGVTVRQATEADLPRLAELLAATSEVQDFTPFGLDYLTTMYRELGPAGQLVGFVGEAAGRSVAMALLTGCGTALKVRLVGFDRSEEVRRLNVPAAVYWTAMKWARENGYLYFDFGGVLDESLPALLSEGRVDVDALPGQDGYKVRFGGQLFLYSAPVEMIRPAALRLAYDLARRSAAGQALVARARRIARTGLSGRR
jgi:lipid II:glycine glycyltransferase (peptidoglycan interpeptide bridge formation enzyme)